MQRVVCFIEPYVIVDFLRQVVLYIIITVLGNCCYVPHGPSLAIVTRSRLIHDCRLMWQAERSWISSDVQTGSAVSGHVGQIHSAVLFTVRQPML